MWLNNKEFFTTPDFINGIPRASEIPAPDLTNENATRGPWEHTERLPCHANNPAIRPSDEY